MTALPSPLLLIGVLAGLALLLSCWQLQVSRRLRRELTDLRRQLTEASQVEEKESGSFSASLSQAEQQRTAPPEGQRSSTDKYRYVAALAEQGVDAQGIAEALKLAPAEVAQLLSLARLNPRQ